MRHNTNDSKTLILHYLLFSELVPVLVLCHIRVTDMWHVDIHKSSTSKNGFWFMEGILGLILYFLGSPGGAFLWCPKEFIMRFLGPCWYSTHFLPDICFDFEVFMVLR